MRQLIPLITGVVTIYGIKLAGDKRWQGWLVGLLNQVPWLVFIVAFDAWGLLPLNVFLAVMYYRNLRKWREDERATKALLASDRAARSAFLGIPVTLKDWTEC